MQASEYVVELDDYAKLSSVVAALIAKTCVAVLTVEPSHGPKEGGTVVVVGGYGFSQSIDRSSSSAAAACRFGSTSSELVAFVNDTSVVCRTTAGEPGATVPVSYAADGVAFCSSAANFAYDGGGGGCPSPDCDGHGQCVNDQCFCNEGWSGPNCDEQSCPHDCCGHGTCDGASGTCTCNDGYAGPDCCNEVCRDANAHARGVRLMHAHALSGLILLFLECRLSCAASTASQTQNSLVTSFLHLGWLSVGRGFALDDSLMSLLKAGK